MARARRLLFSVLTGLVALAGVELVSWGFLAWTFPGDPREAVSAVAASGEETAASGREARRRLRGSEVIHPYLGYVLAPSGPTNELTLDALGFPGGGPFVRERRPDTVTWAVFGGSFAASFAGFGGLEQVFAELQTLPELAGKRLVVLSASLPGFKQPQSLFALAYLLSLGLEIDAVFLIDGFNEVTLAPAENLPIGVFPFFPRGWGQRSANLSFATELRALIGEVAFLARLRAETAQRLLRSPLRFSRSALLAWRFVDRALEARLTARRLELASPDVRAPLDYLTTGPRYSAPDAASVYRDLVSVWKEGSLQMHSLCQGRGIRFHHFLQPNQYVPNSKPMARDERLVALAPVHLYRHHVEEGYPLLREAGRELAAAGVSFHDLTQIFADVTEPLYVDTCCHLGARGNQLLAHAIATSMLADRARDAKAEGEPGRAPGAGVPGRTATQADRPLHSTSAIPARRFSTRASTKSRSESRFR